MKSAKYIREALHDMLCRSVDICWFDPAYVPEELHDETRARCARLRGEHARASVFAGPARAFRKTDTEDAAAKVFHDAVCRAGAGCERGAAHLSARSWAMIRDFRAA
ncbi:hypothetical protein BKA00_007462 [Actinomadura coerulea]|uniref:Uncharacterized protein n=1 Tax=Actinomadura coerulea TaxID=46159 RepID=A0A7X0L3B6_9ACTN|nr:hypothetical protein [Actinomadura coerulea]MBB6400548.1 hypothetical protein [Actinomadura coerulea]GGQ08040.1 hypothetical protein GCM10010187_25170 [Actinomadura coerulea]